MLQLTRTSDITGSNIFTSRKVPLFPITKHKLPEAILMSLSPPPYKRACNYAKKRVLKDDFEYNSRWIENKIMLDSIITDMIEQCFFPPVAPKVYCSEIGLTCRKTLKILNTIKPITRAFTLMDAPRSVKDNGKLHAGTYFVKLYCT